jgi:NAD(P)-dependent dehydrogenase (short-subunit alcohol dehydrogenase family)
MTVAGKTILLTGASSGIGLEAAVKLARQGAQLVMVARSPERGEAALADVRLRSGSATVSMLYCDFGSQAQVRRLAQEVRAQHMKLHVLINNAGSVSDRRQVTEDGLEQTFAVNHLGYYLLTTLLLDRLEASAPARVVCVASVGHYRGDLDLDDLQYERGYTIMKAYQRSKLANVMFTLDLARRLEGRGVTVNALHPGVVASGIWARAPWWAQPILAVAKLGMVSPEQGGDRIVYLASSPDVEGKTGGYYEADRLKSPVRLARDETLQAKLWDVSTALVAKSAR